MRSRGNENTAPETADTEWAARRAARRVRTSCWRCQSAPWSARDQAVGPRRSPAGPGPPGRVLQGRQHGDPAQASRDVDLSPEHEVARQRRPDVAAAAAARPQARPCRLGALGANPPRPRRAHAGGRCCLPPARWAATATRTSTRARSPSPSTRPGPRRHDGRARARAQARRGPGSSVGLPNAGKSTLLRALKQPRARVGAWAFTTLQPNIGTVVLDNHKGRPYRERRQYGEQPVTRFTIADIPGLVEDAHLNKGLGHEFLRHVERAKMLAFVIDVSAGDGVTALKSLWREVGEYQQLKDLEATEYSQRMVQYNPFAGPRPGSADPGRELFTREDVDRLPPITLPPMIAKPWFVVATKADLPETRENFARLQEYVVQVADGAADHPSGRPNSRRAGACVVVPVSAIQGRGHRGNRQRGFESHGVTSFALSKPHVIVRKRPILTWIVTSLRTNAHQCGSNGSFFHNFTRVSTIYKIGIWPPEPRSPSSIHAIPSTLPPYSILSSFPTRIALHAQSPWPPYESDCENHRTGTNGSAANMPRLRHRKLDDPRRKELPRGAAGGPCPTPSSSGRRRGRASG